MQSDALASQWKQCLSSHLISSSPELNANTVSEENPMFSGQSHTPEKSRVSSSFLIERIVVSERDLDASSVCIVCLGIIKSFKDVCDASRNTSES